MQWSLQDTKSGCEPGYHAGMEKALQDAGLVKALEDGVDMMALECRGFEAVRKPMDGAARVAKAEECKTEANAHHQAKAWSQALVGYTAGIWFIMRGDPPCPKVMASAANEAAFAELPGCLGAGAPKVGTPEPALTAELEARRDALRVALHLNLAAAALKLSRWTVARTACEYVLMVQGSGASPKARYRLAQALEGQQNIAEACDALETLLKHDASNADAAKYLTSLRERLPAPKVDYETMDAEQWAKLSREEQEKALDEINRKLDEDMGEDSEWDAGILKDMICRQDKK